MCTVSWIVKDQDYRLYFNRDEQRSRPRAEPPRIREWGETRIIAPLDAQGGGSWIAVNQQGITAFLLNNYSAGKRDFRSGEFRSRGELPMRLASQSSFDKCLGAVADLELHQFRPFYLGVIGPLKECQVFGWNGVKLERRHTYIPFVTTSSFRSDDVESYRRERYLEICGKGGFELDLERRLDFHMDLSHPDKAFNPLMSREDAETHCISVVSVTPSQVSFDYYEGLTGEESISFANVCSIERKRPVL